MASDFYKGPQNKAKNRPEVIDAEVSSADERKTVIADNDFEGLEFEDKMWLYWKTNKNFIITCVVVAFGMIIGIQAHKQIKAANSTKLANAYSQVSTFEQRTEFAKTHSGTVTAGVALLENADEKYAKSEYSESAKLYKDASEALKGSILADRAMLGSGMSLLLEGKLEEGKFALKTLSEKAEKNAYVFESAFHYAVIIYQSGNLDEAKKLFETIANNNNAAAWKNLAQGYLDRMVK